MTRPDTEVSRLTRTGDTADETSEVPPTNPDPPPDFQQNVARTESNVSATAAGIIAIALLFGLALQIDPVRLGLGLRFGGGVFTLLAVPVGICAIILGLVGLGHANRMRSSRLVVALAIVGVLGGFLVALASVVWLFSPGGAVF